MKSQSILRQFLDAEASSGIVLVAAAGLALLLANSPLADGYFHILHVHLGPLSILHWINDALMALFFLQVGLEIKREMLDGELATWPRRTLPGLAAAGGMAAPAVVYVGLNLGNPEALRGWAIPAATDIAFALGVLSLLGNRVPASLKAFLAALAIIDDLGVVLIIALVYSGGPHFGYLAGAVAVLGLLVAMNRWRVRHLVPYLALGVVLWFFVFQAGVHATLAGVALAATVPLRRLPGIEHHTEQSPVHRLEERLQYVVPFVVVPIFGLANAGVALTGTELAPWASPVTSGVVLGLVFGKMTGVFLTTVVAVRLGIADMPQHATWRHIFGGALLCGIGFTMSIFVSLLAFPDSEQLQDQAKIGVLAGSVLSAIAGSLVLACRPHSGKYSH
ncbi:Na+/H+ antiporter NhaA [Ensifer sp. BR816]|uniref:Na+/H+ antiporter NhaA n=1 Tax=Rhizobium sp. (strain BR816) TaxID=1057002 RepID=UPI00036E5D9F